MGAKSRSETLLVIVLIIIILVVLILVILFFGPKLTGKATYIPQDQISTTSGLSADFSLDKSAICNQVGRKYTIYHAGDKMTGNFRLTTPTTDFSLKICMDPLSQEAYNELKSAGKEPPCFPGSIKIFYMVMRIDNPASFGKEKLSGSTMTQVFRQEVPWYYFSFSTDDKDHAFISLATVTKYLTGKDDSKLELSPLFGEGLYATGFSIEDQTSKDAKLGKIYAAGYDFFEFKDRTDDYCFKYAAASAVNLVLYEGGYKDGDNAFSRNPYSVTRVYCNVGVCSIPSLTDLQKQIKSVAEAIQLDCLQKKSSGYTSSSSISNVVISNDKVTLTGNGLSYDVPSPVGKYYGAISKFTEAQKDPKQKPDMIPISDLTDIASQKGLKVYINGNNGESPDVTISNWIILNIPFVNLKIPITKLNDKTVKGKAIVFSFIENNDLLKQGLSKNLYADDCIPESGFQIVNYYPQTGGII
jgi:hypothetical protein